MDTESISLRRIGYWCHVGSGRVHFAAYDALPDPRVLVEPSWDPNLRNNVLGYLRQGWIRSLSPGYSYCRFECGIPDSRMGSRTFTDGVWVWPEGLSHYIEAHAVGLPFEFLDHLQQRGFKYPDQVTHSSFLMQSEWMQLEMDPLLIAEQSKTD